jgi:tripartite-type tricarboxylate transporter receptor subunit TctC
MMMTRTIGSIRKVTSRVLLALATVAASNAWGADFPTKPVRLIVPYTAGGGTDYMARSVAQKLGTLLGQPVIVDNRPAVDGVMGTATVATARPDGYTLLLVSTSHAINTAIGRKLPYDALKDFEPVIHTANQQLVLVSHPSVPVKSVKELVSFARSKPDVLNYGSSSNASALPMELLKSLTRTRIQHIPYKGSAPMLADLVGGQIQISIAPAIAAIPHARSGKLNALGVSGARRAAALPDLPTIAEAGVTGFEALIWTGMLAPAKTPRLIVVRLNSEVAGVVGSREFQERLLNAGAEAAGGTPEGWGTFLKTEVVKWTRIARLAGFKDE